MSVRENSSGRETGRYSMGAAVYCENSVRVSGAASGHGTAHRVRTSPAPAPRCVRHERVPRPAYPSNFPTVLVAAKSVELGQRLLEGIEEEKVLVLKARNQRELLGIVQLHSRPIHVVLLDIDIGERMAAHLKRYRAKMHLVLVSGEPPGHPNSVMGPQLARAHLRNILRDIR